METNIQDSGERREFTTGAVRDIADGKGRCDLMPIDVIASLMPNQDSANILYHISEYMRLGQDAYLFRALQLFASIRGWTIPQMLREVSVHYEEGCIKYGERNWEKGIPLHCYIDSGVRHFLKYCDCEEDERHDRAFVWNLLGAIWTCKHLPDMIDITFEKTSVSDGCSEVLETATIDDADDVLSVSRSKLVDLLSTLDSLA